MAQRRRSGKKKKSSGGGSPTRGTAPSAPSIMDLEKFEASEEAKAHDPSTVDAMGQDKRREVVGHSYGPSKRSQVMFFFAVAALLAIILGGWTLAVAAFDTAPESYPDKAPWSADGSELSPTSSPSGPCGEPGNAYPPPAGSPCAAQTSGKTTEREPTSPGSGDQEESSGGVGGSESQAASN